MANNEQIYLDGLQTFTPSVDDNPDCVPFYRAWRGMETVLSNPVMNQYHHLLHEAICWASHLPIEEQFAAILKHAKYMCERGGRAEEPRYSYSWECQPSEPTEQDARAFFNSEYKRAFPDKRINSKHAKEQWATHQEKALSIVREQYEAKLIAYQTREQARQAENERKRDEWISAAWSMANFESVVRSLAV